MHEVIRRQQEHATAGLIGNGIHIDTAVSARFAGQRDALHTHSKMAVPNPARELRPLRISRMLVGDQSRHGREQSFLVNEEHLGDRRVTALQ